MLVINVDVILVVLFGMVKLVILSVFFFGFILLLRQKVF